MLDLSSLKLAIDSLRRGIVRAQATPSDEELRDAVIQRFEYTYELCWKMLKRHLESASPNPASIDQLAFRDLLRLASEHGLPINFDDWIEYRHQRNVTAHTYNRQKAQDVYHSALRFIEDASKLFLSLEQYHAH